MTDQPTLHLLLLDEQWQPRHRIEVGSDWHATVDTLLQSDSQWLVIEQQRNDQPVPHPSWSDIRLTRALSKRLRPIEIRVADHIIRGALGHFSFRESGLL